MGLLSKVADFQNNSDSIIRKKKSIIENFFLKAKVLNNGFEYSGTLFELFCKYLDIKKGALLISDKNSSTFFPSSSLNMDMTTTRHLRIERSILETQFQHYSEIIFKDDSRIKSFKQYFSIREFSALTSLMLVPFYISGILSALLFIIDPKNEKVEIAREISLNSEKLIERLLSSRKPFTSISVEEKNDIETKPIIILKDFFDNNISEYFNILIVTMQIKNLKSTILKLVTNTDSYEISNNIILSIKRLINNSGKLIELSSDKYILLYKIKSGTTPGLILHQINIAISSFFNLTVSLPEIEADIRTFPASGNYSAESVLEGII